MAKLVLKRSSHAGFIMASRLSRSLDSINYSRSKEHWASPTVPPPAVVSSLFSNLAEGLRRVCVRGPYMTDDAIEALSLSPAAKMIQDLTISHALITDSAAHVWQRFPVLRILDISPCNLFDMPTFVEIAKHQALESFYFSCYEAGAPPATAIFPILLAPDSLPSLTSLHVTSGYPTYAVALRDLVELVRRRPNRAQLRGVGHAKQNGVETDLLVELHEMCPNLEGLCSQLQASQHPIPEALLRNMPHFKESSDTELAIKSEEDLFVVAKRFPLMESLMLDGYSADAFAGFPFVDFGSLVNLKRLYLTSSVLSPLNLPPRLEDLVYSSRVVLHSSAPDQITALFLSICNTAPKLKNLSISLPNLSLTRTHALILLNRLPALDDLTLRGSSNGETAHERLEICHPNVSWIDVSSNRLSYAPLWWPNKRDVNLRGELDPMLEMLHPVRAPILRGLSINIQGEETYPPPIPVLVDAIRRCGHQILSLTLDTYVHTLSQGSFTSMLSLRHLCRLEMSYLPLTQENAQILVSAMPLLSRLDLNFVVKTPDASWLKLSRLRYLSLTLGLSKHHPATKNHDPGLFILQAKNMPLLAHILVTSTSPVISGVHLSGFEHLGEAALWSSSSNSFEVDLSKCKSLFTIMIRDALLRSLRLSDLSRLIGVNYRACQLHEEAVLSISECPRLRYCESCKDHSNPAGAEKCLQLEEAIRLQAADVKYLQFI
jgi:hypothetical protein